MDNSEIYNVNSNNHSLGVFVCLGTILCILVFLQIACSFETKAQIGKEENQIVEQVEEFRVEVPIPQQRFSAEQRLELLKIRENRLLKVCTIIFQNPMADLPIVQAFKLCLEQ
mgnify:CR=1 FL=1